MRREVFGQNQTNVLQFLYRRGGNGYASRDDVEICLWDAVLWRSRAPRQGARNALKSLTERGYLEKHPHEPQYRITAQGREVVRRWREEASP